MKIVAGRGRKKERNFGRSGGTAVRGRAVLGAVLRGWSVVEGGLGEEEVGRRDRAIPTLAKHRNWPKPLITRIRVNLAKNVGLAKVRWAKIVFGPNRDQ